MSAEEERAHFDGLEDDGGPYGSCHYCGEFAPLGGPEVDACDSCRECAGCGEMDCDGIHPGDAPRADDETTHYRAEG